VIVVIEGEIAFKLHRYGKLIFGSGESITMVIRVLVFSSLGVLSLVMAVAWVIAYSHDQAFDIILALLPVSAFLVFGSQMDLVRVWMFWRQPRTSYQEV